MGVKKSFEAIERLSTRGYFVKLLCCIAQVSRSGYYRYVQATQKPNRDVLLAEKVRQVQEEVRFSYGAKRMAHALSKQTQEPINHKRVARIMREYLVGAQIRLRRHPEYWYRQRHTERLSDRQCAPNILNRDFLASCPRKKLVTDVTWITCADGTLYLSAVMDLFNRQIMSYSLSRRNTTATALNPILALARSYNLQGTLVHCDRGPAYRSEAHQALLRNHGIVASYSRAGNCWDNALMECFFGHMKCELGLVTGSHRKQRVRQVSQKIHEYITFYNMTRIQKNLGWLSPMDYIIQYTSFIESKNVST